MRLLPAALLALLALAPTASAVGTALDPGSPCRPACLGLGVGACDPICLSSDSAGVPSAGDAAGLGCRPICLPSLQADGSAAGIPIIGDPTTPCRPYCLGADGSFATCEPGCLLADPTAGCDPFCLLAAPAP